MYLLLTCTTNTTHTLIPHHTTPHTTPQVFWLYRLSLSLRRSKSPLLRHTLYMLLHHLDTISVDGLCSVVLSQAYVDTQRVNNAFASKVLQRAVDIVPTQHTYTWQLSNMIWSIARVNHPLAGEHVPVCVGCVGWWYVCGVLVCVWGVLIDVWGVDTCMVC